MALFTIITVCKNAAQDLWLTFQSIIGQQSMCDFEYIIVDGASVDNTPQILDDIRQQCAEKNIKLHIISEPDNGIYDAMNKGVQNAHGQWLNFMNAGDSFAHMEVLKNIATIINMHDDADIIYGSVLQVMDFGEVTTHPRQLDFLNRKMAFCHQSAFIRRTCLLEHPYSLDYRLTSDYDFFYWCYLNGKKFMKTDETVARFENERGLSSKNRLRMNREYGRINGRIKKPGWWLEYVGKIIEVGFNMFWRALSPKAFVNKIRHNHYNKRSAPKSI